MAKKKIKKSSGNYASASKRAAKKAAVLGDQRKSSIPMIIALVIGAICLGGGTTYLIGYWGKSPASVTSVSSQAEDMEMSAITYPVSQFGDGKAHHFSYKADGLDIRYFVLKSSDGVIRAAFDACNVCWRAGKGYYQDGDDMVCRNCGRRFASVRINEVKGGCNPAPLYRSLNGDHLVIAVDDIMEGKGYFNFSKGSSS